MPGIKIETNLSKPVSSSLLTCPPCPQGARPSVVPGTKKETEAGLDVPSLGPLQWAEVMPAQAQEAYSSARAQVRSQRAISQKELAWEGKSCPDLPGFARFSDGAANKTDQRQRGVDPIIIREAYCWIRT